jgi:hypothetical protein
MPSTDRTVIRPSFVKTNIIQMCIQITIKELQYQILFEILILNNNLTRMMVMIMMLLMMLLLMMMMMMMMMMKEMICRIAVCFE